MQLGNVEDRWIGLGSQEYVQMDKFGKFGIQMTGWEVWEVMGHDWIRVNIGCKRIGLV